jgi:pimeloyl-ACP methyl ester carboxylesterase
MSWTRLRLVGRRPAAAALALLLGASGCTYLGFTVEKKRLRSETKHDPSLGLAREAAPEDCYQLVGRVTRPVGWSAPLLVAAIGREGERRELVASREVLPETGYYTLLLPSGLYDLVLLADRDGNGFYESGEVAGGTPPGSPVEASGSKSADGFVVDGPGLTAAGEGGGEASVPLRIRRTPRSNVVRSLDDEMFDPKWGEEGMYRPTRLLAATQGLFFGLEPFDRSKTVVLFVHGINGTPRDFKALAGGLDRSRFQPWFFYYPSGMPLDKLGAFLARGIRIIGSDPELGVAQLVVVAHSMGGLVSRRALNELCAEGRPAFLKGYVSFSSPYGGTDSAARGVREAPEVVPSWRDTATGSDFVARLHRSPIPADLPFHLFFGWGKKGENGPSPAGDGVVLVRSQLDPRAQLAATRIHGFEESHVGILENAEAGKALYALIDSFVAPKPR